MEELTAIFESARRDVEAQMAPMAETMTAACEEIECLVAPVRDSLRDMTWTF